MKKISFLILLLTVIGSVKVSAQNKTLSEPEPFFWAIIVQDMDSSIAWYQENLDLEVLYNNSNEERGFKQAALQRESLLLELLEIRAALSSAELLKDQPPRTPITGIYKIGFRVNDFDSWYEKAQQNGVNFHGRVVDDPVSGKRMIIMLDPDGNRIQLFEK